MRHTPGLTLTLLTALLALAGCDSSSSSNKGNDTPPPAASLFTQSQDWTVTLNQKDSDDKLNHTRFCYDFVNGTEGTDTQCDSGTQWGLIVDNGRSPRFWTNGGATNPAADGAAFAFFDWDELSQWNSATTDPSGTNISIHYTQDVASGVFNANITPDSWFAYDLDGTHKIHPNFNVYLITSDNSQDYAPATTPTWALQITSYYGGATGKTSGHLGLRWIDATHSTDVQTANVDASSDSNWVYFDLQNGTVVDVPDDTNWQIAFKRTAVMLNGGDAGNGTIGGFIGQQQDGFYDASGNPVKAKFDAATLSNTLDALQQTANYSTPASAGSWVTETNSAIINPAPDCIMDGHRPLFCNYGLYSYNPAGLDDGTGTLTTPAHGLAPRGANPDYDTTDVEQAALLRSGDGESYARFYVTDIQYAAKADGSLDANGSQTWTFHFDVQPAN